MHAVPAVLLLATADLFTRGAPMDWVLTMAEAAERDGASPLEVLRALFVAF
jgi:hypothetical protein